MKKFSAVLVAAAAVSAAILAYSPATRARQSAGSSRLTIDQLIDIRHPSNATWSPDGRRLAFVWDRAGVSDWCIVEADGSSAPRAVIHNDGGVVPVIWAPDGQSLNRAPDGTRSPDGQQIAVVRAGNPTELWLRTAASGKESRLLTQEGNITAVGWSPDAAYLLYTGGGRTIRHEQTPAYSGAKIIYTITENVPGQMYAVKVPASDAARSEVAPIAFGQAGFGPRRWIDNRHFVFDRTSADFKRRTTYVADVTGGEPRVLHEDVEPKFWSLPPDAGLGGFPSPDGKWVAFLSDRDGWDHLYVMRATGGEPVQLTRGRFEAWRPAWSPDSTRIAFDANEPDHPGDRHLGVVTLNGDPARATLEMITTGRGTDIAPIWSPDGKRLVYQHTDARNSADLYVIEARASAKPIRLTDSLPATVDRASLVEPELVHYAGPDGQQVPAWLFVPKNVDRTRKHPAVVWIHGDGINQNYDGWHVQRNYAVYYSFHQYLLQKGYVVIAPDYRGSIGYGREWRTGVYMDVGGKDAKDAWMAANYLKSLGYVDMDRVGVWGLSYGGFFTLIAVTDQPKLFRAGVDVAGVVDYAMYYDDPYHGGWTASRIGTPEQNPQVYAQASPVSHIDRLERPLLVLHGTSDVNVPYLHSVRLIDEALKKGKGDLLSFMMYPGEFHYFTRAHVLGDAWRRVDAFFDQHLHPAGTTTH
jgi:dipeptidyl aminopeptidase/acylaminoacyl peptidase